MRNNKSFKEQVSEDKERLERQFKSDLSNLSESRQNEVRQMSAEVEKEMDLMNSQMDEGIEIENKFRKAGFTPSQAEALLKESKHKEIGRVFKFFGKEYQDETVNILYTAFDRYYVKTPFNTVVEADVYIQTLQDQLVTVAKINDQFTSGSFFGLIGLAFKRLYNNLLKGNKNG